MKVSVPAIGLLVLALCVVGCMSPGAGDARLGTEPEEAVSARESDKAMRGTEGLTGRWLLVEIDGQPAPETVELDMTISEDGGISGYAGCNRFMKGRGASQEGETEPFHFEIFGMSRRACQPDRAAIESEFVGVLREVRGHRLRADRLELVDTDQKVRLIYQRAAVSEAPRD